MFARFANWQTMMTGLVVTNVASSSTQVALGLIFQMLYVHRFFIAHKKQAAWQSIFKVYSCTLTYHASLHIGFKYIIIILLFSLLKVKNIIIREK